MQLRRIRDPIHGFIHYSDEELKLVIDSPYFKRLRGIKQLALTHLVYPGAMHTRFEHSLGVMEMATRAFVALEKNQGDQLRRNFRQFGLNLNEARQLLRLTALLHDTGHLPFSHAAEGILPKGKTHEDISVAITHELSRKLDRSFYEGISDHICSLIQKNAIVPPELQILKKLISSQLDVDRADYLLRDSLHCGVEYGNFDYLRLFEMLRVVPGREGGLELAVEAGGVHSLEALILARYYMFAQVYFHKVRRIFDIYLADYMKSWCGDRYRRELMNVIKDDDFSVHASLQKDCKNTRSKQHELATRIIERRHHKVVAETNDFAEALDKRDIGLLSDKLRARYTTVNFIPDIAAEGTIHKFHQPGDEQIGEEFKVVRKFSSGPISLSQESKIIAKLPKRFAVYRIYADCKSTTKLLACRSFATKNWDATVRGR